MDAVLKPNKQVFSIKIVDFAHLCISEAQEPVNIRTPKFDSKLYNNCR